MAVLSFKFWSKVNYYILFYFITRGVLFERHRIYPTRKYTMQGHKPSCWCNILQVSPRERRAAWEKSQWHKTRRLRHSAVSAVPVQEHGWQSQPWLLTLGQHVVYLSSSTKAFSSRTRSLSCWRQVLNAAPIRPWIKRTSALMGWLRGKRVLKRSKVNALLLWQAPRTPWRA